MPRFCFLDTHLPIDVRLARFDVFDKCGEGLTTETSDTAVHDAMVVQSEDQPHAQEEPDHLQGDCDDAAMGRSHVVVLVAGQ